MSYTEAASKVPGSSVWSIQYDIPTSEPTISTYYQAFFSPIVLNIHTFTSVDGGITFTDTLS